MTRVASTAIDDPKLAIRAIFAELKVSTLSGIVLFCSSRYALDQVAAEAAKQRSDLTIIGCTSAGEITPDGIASGTMTAVGFPTSEFRLKAMRFEDLDNFDPVAAKLSVERLVMDTRAETATLVGYLSRVALLFIDGLSHREELFAHALQNCLGSTPLIGASSGGDLEFRHTSLLYDGVFRNDCAILAILSSTKPLKPFCQRYQAPGSRLAIITRADPVARRVYEINGENAAVEYARLVGIETGGLSPAIFAANPLMVRVAGQHYARSIQRHDKDGSLVFQSAIARGLVTRIGQTEDIAAALDDAIRSLRAEVGGTDSILVFDDIHNKIESSRAGYLDRVGRMYTDNGIVGFNSYGEQFKELHLNQSVVGVAIGREYPC